MNELLPATIEPVEQDKELTATTPDEMRDAQSALIDWCRWKIQIVQAEAADLQSAFEHAKKNKWRNDTLERHWKLALKRVDFYERMLVALEHGYQIVPPFPVTVFAIRTARNSPLKVCTDSKWDRHEQIASGLPAGEGEYKNPFPEVYQRKIAEQTATVAAKYNYFAESWKELEFPVTMAKPKIMEATTRAMALEIFDDLGLLPQARAADPVIVARLLDCRSTRFNRRYVYFLIGWHLNTRDL